MTRLVAKTTELDRALAMLAGQQNAESEFAGSRVWCEATARVHGSRALVPLELRLEEESAGFVVLERVTADWRSGSPGQSCLRWPFQEFGYHFAPTWLTVEDTDAARWVDAIAEAFPDDHIELRRCAAAARFQPAHARARVDDGPPTWRQEVDGDLERWRRGLHGEHRRDLAYYARRIQKAGGVWFDSGPDDDLAPALADCFELHARRVAQKGQASAYLEADAQRFLTELAELDRQNVRIARLRIGEDVVAANLSFVHDGRYQCFMPGWDPSHRKLDLGRQVIYHQVVREFGSGLRSIDLLGGDLPYKREFGLTPHPTVDIIARPSKVAAVREDIVSGALRVYRRFAGR